MIATIKPLYCAVCALYNIEPRVPMGAWARWDGSRFYGRIEVRFV